MEDFFKFCGFLTTSELYIHACYHMFSYDEYLYHHFPRIRSLNTMIQTVFSHFCLRKIAMDLFIAFYTFALLAFFSCFYDFLFDSFCNFLEIYTYPRINIIIIMIFSLQHSNKLYGFLVTKYIQTYLATSIHIMYNMYMQVV